MMTACCRVKLEVLNADIASIISNLDFSLGHSATLPAEKNFCQIENQANECAVARRVVVCPAILIQKFFGRRQGEPGKARFLRSQTRFIIPQ
jgi:hypothetical protein